MKKRVLWISPYAPYDKVAHGGGKTHNYYVKYFHHNSNCEITLISLCMNYEEENLDLDGYGISNNIYVMDKTIYSKIHRLLLSGVAFRNPFDKYGGKCLPYERAQIKKMIQQYSKENEPNLIILQWTFSLMLIDDLKKRFPNSKIIAIEEDVSFLNYDRKRLSTPNIWSKYFWSKRYKTLKKVELENLQKTDVVVTNNFKDSQLLIENGLECSKIYTAAPYIADYSVVKRERKDKNIIFFGDMSREENYNSAIWFIKHVMPLIKDTQIYFTIIGNKPNNALFKYKGPRVKITGYVEDVSSIFSTCMCMVAPLVGGAGIKIKVLEAMSAGIPVLTNEIGIEGIAAVAGKDFLYCTSPEEYALAIDNIAQNPKLEEELSDCSRKFINDHFNLANKLEGLIRLLELKD